MRNQTSSTGPEPFAWQALEQRIAGYLHESDVPSGEAGRLSRTVIRICADAADSLDPAGLDERALDEARILLETWRAARRERRPAAR